jgi:AcrR family transcriptional regulator
MRRRALALADQTRINNRINRIAFETAVPSRPGIKISTRKRPQQARSAGLVEAILDAAVQVLAKEGAQRFTTARVAEKAGVSVGSLYQYFPNKAAILFRLQSDEWQRTSTLLGGILEDTAKPPLERLRALVHAFIRSECDEAAVRIALDDAAPLYRDAPEAQAAKASGAHTMQLFMRETLPVSSDATRSLASALITATLSAVGKNFSEKPRTGAEIEAYADAMADMFCAYLRSIADV